MRLFVKREKELNAENAEKIKGLATKAQSHEEINNKKTLVSWCLCGKKN